MRPSTTESPPIAGRLPSWSLSTEFQPETFRAIVSVAVLDQILRAVDRAIAEQAPPNIFVRAARSHQAGRSITMPVLIFPV